MMKLRQSLKNSARSGLKLSTYVLLPLLLCACISSTEPSYSKETLVDSIQNICKDEYNIEVKAKLIGQTLWIYLPLEDLIEKSDKPEKYLERFSIEHNKDEFKDGLLKLEYSIKVIPEKEKYQEVKYNKLALEKMNNVWKVLRRVLFSMKDSKKDGLQFFCFISADIKNGFQMKEIFYYLDLKKVSYEFISLAEYQHRTIQDTQIQPEIIGDKEGLHLNYRDIPFEEFLMRQIEHRIRLKFQKPEVDKNVDIDKEIIKIVVYTLKTYNFRDFSTVELNNLLTNNKIILNQAAIWARPMD